MMVHITQDNFEQEIMKASKPVVIDAYATWCGPCKMMEPSFDELARVHGEKYIFAKLNVDDERQIAIQFGVTSVPTFIFLKQGKLISQEIGYMNQEELEEKISSILG